MAWFRTADSGNYREQYEGALAAVAMAVRLTNVEVSIRIRRAVKEDKQGALGVLPLCRESIACLLDGVRARRPAIGRAPRLSLRVLVRLWMRHCTRGSWSSEAV